MIEVPPGPTGQAMVSRAVGAVAARCDMPVDRLEDAVLVLECLLSGTPHDERLAVELEGIAGAISVRCGPYAAGEAQRLVDTCGPDDRPVLLTLSGGAERSRARPGELGDFLELVVASAPPQSSGLL